MISKTNISLSFNPVFIKDQNGRGFTGYLKEFPDLTAQGKNKDEVIQNLFQSLNDILEFRRGQDYFLSKATEQNTRTINLVEV